MTGTTTKTTIRPLAAADLEAVIGIDTQTAGRARRGFFERRLAAAVKEPKHFIYVGAEWDGTLQGFALVSILAGEYGVADEIAVLDAIGVAPQAQGRGIGRALMARIEQVMRDKDIHELRTESAWTSHALLGFLEAAGFTLSPWMVLSRDVGRTADW